MALLISQEEASKAMLDGLVDRIRHELRKRIMERLEPDIQMALDSAMETFKATVETYRDPMFLRDTVRVLIERRDH